MFMLLLLFLQMLMLILFSSLINSSLLCMLTSLRQWLSLCCSMWTFCSYSNVLHWIRWELISHHTSMSFWFKVKMCWFLTVVSAVRNTIWYSFWNVVVHQNISISVTATASDVIMLLTALYTAMMYSSSSQMMKTMTVLMRMSTLLSWDKLHQLCCQWGWSLLTLTFRYVWLLFSFLVLSLV